MARGDGEPGGRGRVYAAASEGGRRIHCHARPPQKPIDGEP